MAFGKDTYNGSNEMKESLLDIIRDVSPNEDNYLVSNIGKGAAALQTTHEWNLFYEDRASSVSAKIEGAATSYDDLIAETRSSNKTAILEAPVRLSRTKASIAMVTGEDAMGKEKERALTRLKSQMEYALVNGTYAAGSSGVSRQLSGIDQCISTLVTAHTSGQSFTETILNDMVQDSFDNVGSSYIMDTVLAPVVIKRRVATFGTNLTRNINASEKRLTKEIRVYDSEVGQTVKILAHKDVRKTAGTLTVLGINESMFEMAFLINSGEPHWEDRAKDGDRENGTYLTEMTLVSYAQKASAKRTGFNGGL